VPPLLKTRLDLYAGEADGRIACDVDDWLGEMH
jgi:hypothetical protein